MKKKIVKISSVVGLLLYANLSTYAFTPMTNVELVADVRVSILDSFSSITKSMMTYFEMLSEEIELNTLGRIANEDEFGVLGVPEGEEIEDIFYESNPPIYVDEVTIPLDPNELVQRVDEMNHEMAEIEARIKEEAAIPVFSDFRQTFYAVTDGDVKVGYGLTPQDEEIENIDNIMHYEDAEYGWLPVVAINIDEVLADGLDERGVPNYYGTILEIEYPDGVSQNAIVLDACGACSWDDRIDLWLYAPDYSLDIDGISYKMIRDGFEDDKN